MSILNKYMEIHGTVYYESQRPPEVPAFVKNHGLLPQPEFQQLLRKAKVSPTPSSILTLARPQTPRRLPVHACHICHICHTVAHALFYVWTCPSTLCCPEPRVQAS